MKRKNKAKGIATAAIIASLYVILTYISYAFGLSSGAIQIRLSEALTILPVFTPYAIPGVFIGCLLSNILTGCAFWDVLFGSLATLIGTAFTYALRKGRFAPYFPPILVNTLIIPLILKTVYSLDGTVIYFILTVFIGEFVSCGILGYLLRKALEKHKLF